MSVDNDGVKVLEGDKEGGKVKADGKVDLKLGGGALVLMLRSRHQPRLSKTAMTPAKNS